MKFLATKIDGVYEIHLDKKGDERGWFMRTFDIKLFQENIPDFQSHWVHMNHSFNPKKYTWRGFHYQKAPHQETKVVRCIAGKVLDCVLDLRENSASFLQTVQIELGADNGTMIYIPKGCAHGFLTLEDNTELIYLHDEFYQPDFEGGVRINDKKINFQLPLEPQIISERDKNHPDFQL